MSWFSSLRDRMGMEWTDMAALASGLFGLTCIAAGIYLSVSAAAVAVHRQLNRPPEHSTAPARTAAAVPACTRRTDPVAVPILMYHYVEHVKDPKDTIRMKLDVLPETLEQQITSLKGAGYAFMTMGEFTAAMDCREHMPAKPVVLTFDDGYRDFYTDVLPILRRQQVKATVYVISGFIGGSNYMTRDQVTEADKSGLVEIGSHTVHHTALAGMPRATLDRELTTAKYDLEALVGKPVVSFCFPYGSYDQASEDAARRAGYASAVTTRPSTSADPGKRYAIGRIRPGGRTGDALLSSLPK